MTLLLSERREISCVKSNPGPDGAKVTPDQTEPRVSAKLMGFGLHGREDRSGGGFRQGETSFLEPQPPRHRKLIFIVRKLLPIKPRGFAGEESSNSR